jgi:trk system potassium uptake protein TrkA
VKSYAIIGLSSFGYYLAQELVKEGMQILVIDTDAEKIDRIRNRVHKAVLGDGTDRETMERLGFKDMDGVVVCLGHIESSVLATLHLKEMKVRRIIVKALSEDHGRLLSMVGAHDVVFPEKDMAYRIAFTLTHKNVLDYVPVAEGYSIVEIAAPLAFIGRSLKELNLREKNAIQVIVVKEMVPSRVVVPTADFVIKDSDVLVIMGKDSAVKAMQGRER